ncbi:MAG: 4Fe-4S binding protein [Firmicutes bacterium]|nr:4Fe-4S binding protein [Bacillota bacterium]
MAKRWIIRIDEEKCNGCGLCIPGCAEGALQIVDGKARLVREALCDGLGACLGDCPQGALYLEEAEAEAFDPELVAALQREQKAKESRSSSPDNGQSVDGLQGGCPGLRSLSINHPGEERTKTASFQDELGEGRWARSELSHWPVQLALISPTAHYLQGAHLLLCADCVPFAFAGFHRELLRDRVVAVACPKLDDARQHVEKLAAVIRANDLASITVARMEVPCCGGLLRMVEMAMAMAGVTLPVHDVVITITGEEKARRIRDMGA